MKRHGLYLDCSLRGQRSQCLSRELEVPERGLKLLASRIGLDRVDVYAIDDLRTCSASLLSAKISDTLAELSGNQPRSVGYSGPQVFSISGFSDTPAG